MPLARGSDAGAVVLSVGAAGSRQACDKKQTPILLAKWKPGYQDRTGQDSAPAPASDPDPAADQNPDQ